MDFEQFMQDILETQEELIDFMSQVTVKISTANLGTIKKMVFKIIKIAKKQ